MRNFQMQKSHKKRAFPRYMPFCSKVSAEMV